MLQSLGSLDRLLPSLPKVQLDGTWTVDLDGPFNNQFHADQCPTEGTKQTAGFSCNQNEIVSKSKKNSLNLTEMVSKQIASKLLRYKKSRSHVRTSLHAKSGTFLALCYETTISLRLLFHILTNFITHQTPDDWQDRLQ